MGATSTTPVATDRFRAGHQSGEVIDRRRPVRFSFNGQPVQGLQGDTIVSALMANGIRAYAQGRRLQSKRGVLSADRFDPSCNLQVDDEPNVGGAHRLAMDGLQVRSQHVWPSLRFDLKAVNQRAARLLRPDSQMRASNVAGFLRPAYRWLASRGDVGGRLGGEGAAHGEVRVGYRHTDVLVVGGGLAGLVAAEAAAGAGARTLLVESDRELGGWLRLADAPALRNILGRVTGVDRATGPDGTTGADEFGGFEREDRVDRVDGVDAGKGVDGLEVHCNAVVVDLDRDGQAIVVAERPDGGEDLTVVRARHVILASGLIERTLTFTGNDLPGVMLATGARRLASLWAVRPGDRAVVLTANSHGDAAVADLRRVGVDVAHVVDARTGGGIRRANGISELAEVVLADGRVVPADCLVVAPGWTVDAALAARAGAHVHYDAAVGRPAVEGRPGLLGVVGALAGDADLDEVIAHATVSGRQGAAAALRGSTAGGPARPLTSVVGVGNRRAAPPQPPLGGPTEELQLDSVSVGVVDFAEDVTAYELVGRDPVTTARLLTAAAAAPALGPRARAELADLGRRLPGVADLTLPLLTGRSGPVEHFAAGPRLGSLARLVTRPRRRTALFDEHVAGGARLARVGDWLDATDYGDPAAERQALAAGVGLCDTGRSGLFDVQGADAVRLVNLLVGAPANGVAPMGANGSPDTGGAAALTPVGGLLEGTDRNGRPVVVARLGDQHWQIRVDASHADQVEGTLLTLVHIEHRNWQAYLTPAGEAQAGLALVGPRAAQVAEEALGIVVADRGVVALPGRATSGPRPDPGPGPGPGHAWSYNAAGRAVVELRVPAGRAAAVWRALLAAGQAQGIRPVGFQAFEGVLDD